MTTLRPTEQRKADVLAALAKNGDLWLATASPSGRPHLIAVSGWWDGNQVVIATVGSSRTAGNLESTGVGRLALGATDDVILIDVKVTGSVPIDSADSSLAKGFVAAVGWNPADEAGAWNLFTLQPTQIQAHRGYAELSGRVVMRGSRWLA
ncbi:MAG: pyridoxamine 5'-phosphate oxidase family protein [Candidatus Dormibacteraeota bacterium]|nr:pyridoxamine 5'-phosphate oxidase family protein [Candidatus Dormibacteraeota bacterium]